MREDEWRKKLDPLQYKVLREKATEAAFTGKYDQHWEQGTYLCAGCNQQLFDADEKFDAGCGWPSFSKASEAVAEAPDTSHGMARTEILCKNCGGHLGHVFADGPKPSGLRYCVNSASLAFSKHNK